MDAFMQIITFGFIAFVSFVLSIVFAANKQNIAGLLFGVVELISGVLSSLIWACALKNSGKTDWFLLGLFRYTPAALIFYAMLLAGVVCIGINFGLIIKQLDLSSSKE